MNHKISLILKLASGLFQTSTKLLLGFNLLTHKIKKPVIPNLVQSYKQSNLLCALKLKIKLDTYDKCITM